MLQAHMKAGILAGECRVQSQYQGSQQEYGEHDLRFER
jgi:hypothetical protein